MSYDPNDAAYDEFIDQLYKEFRDSALDDDQLYERVVDAFKDARLLDYYLEHPDVLVPAQETLAEARGLVGSSPRAALILAVVAAEVCLRDAMLTPVLHGSFHTPESADVLVRLFVATKDEKLIKALLRVLASHTKIDLQTFTRSGTKKPLWEEMRALQVKRNRVIHAAEIATGAEAQGALELAQVFLRDVFGSVVNGLSLHLHGPRVCGKSQCKGDAV